MPFQHCAYIAVDCTQDLLNNHCKLLASLVSCHGLSCELFIATGVATGAAVSNIEAEKEADAAAADAAAAKVKAEGRAAPLPNETEAKARITS